MVVQLLKHEMYDNANHHIKNQKKKMLISRLGDAIKDITPSNRAPPSQKIKESKLLKDIEQQQRTYGTIQQSDIEPQDPKPSTITQLTEGVKDIYRRLSGRKKGQYAQLPTSDPDFKTTLESSKREGRKQGTYAILPQEEMDFEAEIEKGIQNTSIIIKYTSTNTNMAGNAAIQNT